jgi:hypothetical protein
MTDLSPTDWRALCAELVNELEEWVAFGDVGEIELAHALIDRARAALAQPEPQGASDEELYDYWISTSPEFGCADPVGFARAILARWGRPAIEPVPVAERLPGPEDCDGEGRCYAWDGYWWLVRSAVLEEDDTGAGEGYTHWLPHHALPVPQQEAE